MIKGKGPKMRIDDKGAFSGVPEPSFVTWQECSHGIRLRGPTPPRCIECEIVWEAEALMTAEQAVARHSMRLKRLCAEAKALKEPQP